MGELKIEYSDKKVTPFGGMKLLKNFIDKTRVIEDLKSVNLYHLKNKLIFQCLFNLLLNPIPIS